MSIINTNNVFTPINNAFCRILAAADFVSEDWCRCSMHRVYMLWRALACSAIVGLLCWSSTVHFLHVAILVILVWCGCFCMVCRDPCSAAGGWVSSQHFNWWGLCPSSLRLRRCVQLGQRLQRMTWAILYREHISTKTNNGERKDSRMVLACFIMATTI